jgi:hypothetical protein
MTLKLHQPERLSLYGDAVTLGEIVEYGEVLAFEALEFCGIELVMTDCALICKYRNEICARIRCGVT